MNQFSFYISTILIFIFHPFLNSQEAFIDYENENSIEMDFLRNSRIDKYLWPDCIAPENIKANRIDERFIQFSWDDEEPGSSYEVRFKDLSSDKWETKLLDENTYEVPSTNSLNSII